MTPSSPSLLDRFASWTLDHGGTTYGDERERLRWYEGIAITASVQQVLVPWVLAVLAWVADPSAAPLLVIVAAAFYVPLLFTVLHVSRRGVSPSAGNLKGTAIAMVVGAPYLVFGAGIVRANGSALDGPTLLGMVVGGAVGVLAALLGIRVLQRRSALRSADEEA